MGDTTLSRPAFYQYFKDLHELIEASKEICFETAAGPSAVEDDRAELIKGDLLAVDLSRLKPRVCPTHAIGSQLNSIDRSTEDR